MGTVPAANLSASIASGQQAYQQAEQAPLNQMAEYARVANLKQQTADLQQQQQERSLQMQAQQRQLNDQDAFTKTIATFDPAKNSIGDIAKIFTSNGGSGAGALQAQQGLLTQRKNLLGLSDEQFAQQQKQADLVQGFHDQVTAAAPADKPNVYAQGLPRLAAAGVDISKESPQYPGDDVWAQHAGPVRVHSAMFEEAQKDRDTSAKESEAATKALEAKTTQQRLQAEMPGGPMEAPDKAELRSYLNDPKIPGEMLPPAQRTPASFLSWKAKQNPMAVVMGNQLGGPGAGSALDQQAENYFKTGTLPAGFSRSPGTTAAIIKRATELHPDGDLASSKATFNADTNSLKSLQKQFDSMSAFEGTALKNLDLYAQTAAKIPDLGAKFANVPLRMITGGMIGTDNMAALNAARQTASSEVAKVLNSATGAGVLSDTQKKEAQEVVDGNLPFSATMKVVETLKQDMANRHQSYQSDIDTIKGRLGAKPQQPTQPQQQTQASGPPAGATHIGIGSQDKKKHYLDAQGKDLGLAE